MLRRSEPVKVSLLRICVIRYHRDIMESGFEGVNSNTSPIVHHGCLPIH